MRYKDIHNAVCRWVTPQRMKAVTLGALCVCLLGLVACRAEYRNQAYRAMEERAISAEERLQVLSAAIQERETESLQEAIREEQEALTLARILYGYEQAGATTVAQKELVACVPVNRAEPENALWSNDLLTVMQQPDAWQGYREDNPVTEENYKIACRVLETVRQDGIRPIGPEFVYLYVDRQTTQARTEFVETARTRYVER